MRQYDIKISRPVRRTSATAAAVAVAAPFLLVASAVADGQAVGHRVNVNGMRIYYEVSGSGAPLVVLHGAYHEHPRYGDDHPEARAHAPGVRAGVPGTRPHDGHRPPHHLPNLADDVAAFMDAVGLQKADVFGYSMGAIAGLQLAIRHPARVNKLVVAGGAYDLEGWQPEFKAVISQITVEAMVQMPFAKEYPKLAANPKGFPELARKVIALQREPMA